MKSIHKKIMDFSYCERKILNMKLIVGLGNPGNKYEKTRHNIGFMFTDELVKKNNFNFTLDKKLQTKIASGIINNEKVYIIQPQTYMNLSGEAVRAVCKYYGIDVNDILVIYDDLDLPVGKVRIRPNGSSGGHRGMQNIIDMLQTKEIHRIRIGIDGCDKDKVIDYVLGRFNKEEEIEISLIISKADLMIESYLKESFENFMNRYNK